MLFEFVKIIIIFLFFFVLRTEILAPNDVRVCVCVWEAQLEPVSETRAVGPRPNPVAIQIGPKENTIALSPRGKSLGKGARPFSTNKYTRGCRGPFGERGDFVRRAINNCSQK